MNIAAEWSKYYRLSGYRQSLLNGSWEINSINQGIDSLDWMLRDAVKGDYYGVSSGEFDQLKEKDPGSDYKITNARTYIQYEMNAIRDDIEEEEERRRREAANAN